MPPCINVHVFVKYRDISNPSLHLMTLLKHPTANSVYLSSSTCSVCRTVWHESLTHHYTRPVYSKADVLPSAANCVHSRINRHAFIKGILQIRWDRFEISKLAAQNRTRYNFLKKGGKNEKKSIGVCVQQ